MDQLKATGEIQKQQAAAEVKANSQAWYNNLQSAAYENAVILLTTSEKAGGLLCITEQKWREYRSHRWKRLECEIYSHSKTAESENQQGDSVLWEREGWNRLQAGNFEIDFGC